MLTTNLLKIRGPLPPHDRLEGQSEVLHFRPVHLRGLLEEVGVEGYGAGDLDFGFAAMLETYLGEGLA